MSERRGDPRRRTLKSGKVVLNNGASVIDCTVRDVSVHGARLMVPSPLGIPDTFELRISGIPRAVRVVWRTDTMIGVSFSL